MTSTAAMPRPGCFGSPTCHSAAKLPCAQCPFQESCGPIAERVAEGLRRKYGIDLLLRGVSARRPKTDEPLPDMPVKAKEHMDRLQARGIDLKRAIAMRANPFVNQSPAFLRVAVDRLLGGAFTRDELREAFIHELGWSDGTALSHVSIATAVLTHSGVAANKGGRYVMVKEALAA